MTDAQQLRRPRSRFVLSAVLLAIGLTTVQPMVPALPAGARIAQAADPSPAPTDLPAPTPSLPDPTTVPTPAPTDVPTSVPTSTPSADPGSPVVTSPPAPTTPPVPTLPPVPTTAPSATPAAPAPLLVYTLTMGQQRGAAAPAAFPIYELVTPPVPLAADSPHVSSGLDGTSCASCHSAHTAQGTAITKVSPESQLCFGCHKSGASFDVQAEFAGIPANDDSTASYFSHPVSAASAAQHELATDDEFGGKSNRHAVCADCHNPHDANGGRPQLSTTGWTASGDIRAASGVSVTNGSSGSAPAYTLVTRNSGASLTFEYGLCLKCHSGYTSLPVRSVANPSWWALDKGTEFNPSNASYHPVEAGGKNVSAQMAGSLAGTSPFKAWDFAVDSTVRCTNCHGDPSTVNQTPSATPLTPAADAYEPSHASPNRGLLIAPYRDRALKPPSESYASQDFALCYLCHAERPFVDPNNTTNATDTAFPAHGLHLTAISDNPGAGLSIDKPGAGEGLAICAECHFRVHSTAESFVSGDTGPVARASGNTGLVNFAPNVSGFGASAPTWVRPNSAGSGSCTLTCHGFPHGAVDYQTAPGTGFSATPTIGQVGAAGFVVQFSDLTRYISTTAATWAWTFGDGGTSTARNPSHTYVAVGTYTVTLTVRRTSGNTQPMTMSKSSYITVTP